MIAEHKRRQALHALNAVLVGARSLADEDAPHSEIALALDYAEYLPAVMLEDADRTDDFRGTRVGLADRHDVFKRALECFDRES